MHLAGQEVGRIALDLGVPAHLVAAATVEREAKAVSLYRATRDLAATATAIGGRKGTVLQILQRHGIVHVAPTHRPARPYVFTPGVGPSEPQAPRVPVLEPAPDGATTFEKLKGGQCKYPFGSAPPYLFCPAPRQAGHVYCAHHRAHCTRPAPPLKVRIAA